MRKYIYPAVITAFIFGLNSCDEDFLNVSPKDEISSESFFKTTNDATQALVGVYNTLIQNSDYTMIQKALAHNVWSDDAVNVWQGSDYNTIAAGSFGSDYWFFQNNWTQLYRNIRRTNVFLTNIDQTEMDENLKKTYIAEVKFFRAYYYHQLVILFGGVPIVEHPLSLEELKIPRNKRSEVINFILTDLDNAIPDLQTIPAEPGRITNGAAWALKSRVLLYEYRFQEAAEAAQNVMEQEQYGLYTADGNQSYVTLFSQSNENNKEVIFDVQFTDQDGYGSPEQLWLNPSSLSGWAALNPLKSLIDEFEDIDGDPISASAVYDPENPFLNRDPRLDMSILYTGSLVVDHNGVSHTLNTLSGTDASTRSGYLVRKGADPESFVPGITSGKNYILIRYAEVLLNYAEAKNEASGPDVSVYAAVNSIRSRAGMPDLPSGLSKTEMRERIRHERRVELCLEGHRTFDIKRWGIAPAVMNGGIYGVGPNPIENRTFDPDKNYLFPIPQTQIDLTGKEILLQNPGYGTPVFEDEQYPRPEIFQ